MSKPRIWELDALRGLGILGMVAVHLVYDLTGLFGLIRWEYPPSFLLLKDWGGSLFVLLSGVCATLGSRSLRRGFLVFSCGMLCTLVTAALALLGFGSDLIIYFGVLHCLGCCMMLWPLLRCLPTSALALTGCAAAAAGLIFTRLRVSIPWLIPLGLTPEGFATSDYFPLLPHLGFFLLGAALGRKLYAGKKSLLPSVSSDRLPLHFLCGCGRHSLAIYLLHQPILACLCGLISLI